MVNLTSQYRQPTAEELPDSDETPVDNQLQNDIPNFLLSILYTIWSERQDWFFGVDMGIYHNPMSKIPIVPDGFLALGVERQKGENGRLSYVLWEENYVLPQMVFEVVSQTYNGEYDTKLREYEALGILYYVVYNPLSGRKGAYKQRQSLEVYKLVDGQYQQLPKQSIFWLPEIGLGLGCDRLDAGLWLREWVCWYNEQGDRYLTPQEVAEQERLAKQQAEAIANFERLAKQQAEVIANSERQQKEKLAAYLRSLNIDPDQI
jgi:Uma2 family endonuclease